MQHKRAKICCRTCPFSDPDSPKSIPNTAHDKILSIRAEGKKCVHHHVAVVDPQQILTGEVHLQVAVRHPLPVTEAGLQQPGVDVVDHHIEATDLQDIPDHLHEDGAVRAHHDVMTGEIGSNDDQHLRANVWEVNFLSSHFVDEWGAPQEKSDEPAKPKEQPNFGLSGALTKGMNSVNGIDLKFVEPPEARLPSRHWRLYVFKGKEIVGEPVRIHKKTAYLFGRDRLVADIPTDHPSCSSQHAVLQYREIQIEDEEGEMKKVVRPYLMDLGSTNGTMINGEKIEDRRYYEIREKDILKFGHSTREYVLLHADSV